MQQVTTTIAQVVCLGGPRKPIAASIPSSTLQRGEAPLEYDDDVLYGWRREAIARRAIESGKFGASSECAIFAIGCPNDAREFWNLSHLQGNDRRIKDMMAGLKFTHSMPIQRFCWPKIENSQFPLICVGSTMTGKTYTHILFIVTKIINAIPISKVDELANEMKSFKPLAEWSAQNGVKPQAWQPKEEEIMDQDQIDFDGTFGEQQQQNQVDPLWAADVDINYDHFIMHPKYIIVSSSQQQVELLERQFERVKMCLHGEKVNTSRLPPIVKTVDVRLKEEKLAYECAEAEVLIATPEALMKCVRLKYITLRKCQKLFFDDLDLTLQLHHMNVREIIKLYLENFMYFESGGGGADDENCENKQVSIMDACRLYLFSKKWTDLVKGVAGVFPQRTIIFGSMAEASLYAHLKFEIEPCPEKDVEQFKLRKLTSWIDHLASKVKIAILCNNDKQAVELNEVLKAKNYSTELMTLANTSQLSRQQHRTDHRKKDLVYVMSDQSIEILLDCNPLISHMGCLVHYSMPRTWDLIDHRFRLLHNCITEQQKGTKSIMFVDANIDQRLAKDLFDLISRSSITQNSSKLALRDFINDRLDPICWRWATTGVCRLERLTPGVRFGSYCSDKHYIEAEDTVKSLMSVPMQGGQYKISITSIVSPTEFYFRFESHRNMDNYKWAPFEKSGAGPMRALQEELNKHKSTPKYGLHLKQITPGKTYGIYLPHETRVDRIRLLETPQFDIEDKQHPQYLVQYHRQVQVVCIDSGVRISATLGNIFELPTELASLEPMAYRGFHLGFKSTDNEPNWLHEAKRSFYKEVSPEDMIDCTVWLRHANANCFWFEDMVVNRWMSNLDGVEIVKIRPHRTLVKLGFATETTSEPKGIAPSLRLSILTKWRLAELAKEAKYAYLRQDKEVISIYVLDVKLNFELCVRLCDFNKELMELEDNLLDDYKKGKLEQLNYFEENVYCLAKISSMATETDEGFDINRCRIVRIHTNLEVATEEELFEVICLDHGDLFRVKKCDLYLPTSDHIKRLPFQAIRCQLANLDPTIMKDSQKFEQAKALVFKYTRTRIEDKDNQLSKCLCEWNIKEPKKIDLMVKMTRTRYDPLKAVLEEHNELQMFV